MAVYLADYRAEEEVATPPVEKAHEEHEGMLPQDMRVEAAFDDQQSRAGRVQLYEEAQAYVMESIRRAERGLTPEMETGIRLVERIIRSISSESALLLEATDRTQKYAISSHSVNVTVIALQIARTLKYSRDKQSRVGLAGLLHEIGVVRLPKGLVHKSGKLDPAEARLTRQRPVYAGQILQQLGAEYDWLAGIVQQVYERENGQGFPYGLSGEEIREEAKILGMADVFEAGIHIRPYRKALTGRQLFLELTTDSRKGLSAPILKALIRSFSLYPFNETVVLNTGETGRVVNINGKNLIRPLVRIEYDSQGQPMKESRLTDLSKNPSLYITQAISHDALPACSNGQ